jgi:hypothetical protein
MVTLRTTAKQMVVVGEAEVDEIVASIWPRERRSSTKLELLRW